MTQNICTDRHLLLVDDEPNIVRALVRILRRDGYQIHTANSGKEGLELLKDHTVGVIISDQRMPEMNGIEFLSQVKELYPDTIRIVLSGYTDLKSVTDAINHGSIYKFLTKPWEDDLLRTNIREAFEQHELVSKNEYLSKQLEVANKDLTIANQELLKHVERKSRYANHNMISLQVSQDVLENLPMGVTGIGDDGVIALANLKAHELIKPGTGSLIGFPVELVLPDNIMSLYNQTVTKDGVTTERIKLNGFGFVDLMFSKLGSGSRSKGMVMLITPVGN